MAVKDQGSVTRAITKLKAGEDKGSALRTLWDHTMSKLLRQARSRLPDHERRAADEEDIALSAFQSFYEGAIAGRFPELKNRDSLLRLLFTITRRKINAQRNHEHARKRDVGSLAHAEIEAVANPGPSHEFALEIRDELRFALEILPDDDLRQIALLLLQGLDQTEIATQLGCSVRSIQRKQKLIREAWEREQRR
jgi:RNA polymerase sigma factor (sigma-70 family)